MAKKKKMRIRIKKKNFMIFLIFMGLFIYSITQIVYVTIKLFQTSKPKNDNNQVVKKVLSPTEKKLKELNNINEKLSYFNMNYLDRYISYKEKNNDLSNTQIIKNVNMNLDYNFYENTQKAINQDSLLVLVNKHYYLEEEDVPKNLEQINRNYALDDTKLVKEAKEAFEELAKTAKKENLSIVAMSGYRDYTYQVNLYNRYVKSDGKEAADSYSGRPGHSEHQTGLAVDVYNNKENYTNFEKTKEFEWMKEHAHEFGFILRFPKGKELETGYIYESWHYRYVGTQVAKFITENNITLEEYIATNKIEN